MTANRPITMSLPFGLFSSATLSAPLPRIADEEVSRASIRQNFEDDSVLTPLDREYLDMPMVSSEDQLSYEDIYWKSKSA